jgi:hypothetical protein
MRAPLLIALALLLQPVADLEVRATGGQVSVRARGIPLARILERLGKETGMKVIYEAAPPSQIVSAVVQADSEREVLTRILEGLGVSYAFRLDSSGRRVEMLLITGSGSGAGPRVGGSSLPQRPVMPAPIENPESFSEDMPEGFEVQEELPPPPPFEAPEPRPQFPSVPEGARELPLPEFPRGVSYPFP